jgi:hypothetical protein
MYTLSRTGGGAKLGCILYEFHDEVSGVAYWHDEPVPGERTGCDYTKSVLDEVSTDC